mgnify:FL=1
MKNLPKYVGEDRLREFFSQKGEVTDAKLMRTKYTSFCGCWLLIFDINYFMQYEDVIVEFSRGFFLKFFCLVCFFMF